MSQEFEFKPFDISNLDDHELGHLEYILNSPSWLRVFRPFIERCHNQFITYLLDPRKDKKVDEKDLIAGARMTRDMLEFFDKVIRETNHERAMQARISLEDPHPQSRAGALTPAEDY